MKRTNRVTSLLLLSFLSLTLAFSACKKDENQTKTDLLSKSAWKMTAYTVNPAFPILDINGQITGYSNDVFAQMDNCSKDDTYKFNSDNTMKLDEGASKCNSADPQFTAGTWSFNTDETVLTITTDGDPTLNTIEVLTADALKLKFTETDGTTTFTYTATFSH
jgi:hypothetical protein